MKRREQQEQNLSRSEFTYFSLIMCYVYALHRPDQLLADIDDMLADLTTHLDFMIPGST